ncbi:MAG: chaperone NapD [Desulforhopalus sp.]
MPVFSYLATPMSGAKEALCADLSALPYCEVIPADNQDVVVVVTDTPDETAEKTLQKKLQDLQSLQSLSLAFGYDDKEK